MLIFHSYALFQILYRMLLLQNALILLPNALLLLQNALILLPNALLLLPYTVIFLCKLTFQYLEACFSGLKELDLVVSAYKLVVSVQETCPKSVVLPRTVLDPGSHRVQVLRLLINSLPELTHFTLCGLFFLDEDLDTALYRTGVRGRYRVSHYDELVGPRIRIFR